MENKNKIKPLRSRVIILAAGNSTRMGSPKALLTVGKKTLIEYQLDALSLQNQKPIVVLGLQSEVILKAVPILRTKAILIVNKNPGLGQFSSLRLGLTQALNEPTFVLPLDTPAPPPDIWAAIENNIDGFWVVVPKFEGRGGHPVWLSSTFAEQLLRNNIPPSEQRLDTQIKKTKKELYFGLAVSDSSILIDLDTPNDLNAYLANQPRSLKRDFNG